ncbi:MAG TPA: HEAT repeat domain-containing protein [Candidatus Wallbacteria bacterium]|nr:MAG: bifunctional UDP-sugar hydrolase/5'-nucleotidase periplasmic precursor [bacterium ADurb.Bin243]HPG57108.1 HEAT repeat domain-containing protein [Candidatus Wallbacteria bacterium]
MSEKNLDYLLSSPFENDRIKVIYHIVKNRLDEYGETIKKMAAADESLNVRYYARKACAYFESLSAEKKHEEQIDSELEEQKSRKQAVKEKINALGDSEKPEERILAIKGAIKYKIDGFMEFLMRRLHIETDETVIATIIKAFGYTADRNCTPILLKYLKHANFRIVANAIEAIAMLDDERAFPHIIGLLNGGKDNRVAANIIDFLKKYDVDNAIKLLDEMLGFPSDAMVDSAVFVLCGFKSRKVLPLLEKLKNHKNQTIVKKVEAAIKSININGLDTISLDSLADNLIARDSSSPEKSISDSIIDAKNQGETRISRIRELIAAPTSPASIAALDQILKEEKDEYVLAYAVSACSKINAGKNITALKKYLTHQNPRIRANAVEALGEIEGIDLLSILKPVLKDKNNRVRANAIIALRKYPNIDHVAHINEMIKSGDRLMVISSVYAIIQIKNETIPLLSELVKSPDEEIKERALSALDFLGNDLNDLNAKKLLNELGIGTKNISKSAEYIFSKTVLDQLDVAYDDTISESSLIASNKAPFAFTAASLKSLAAQNMHVILNTAALAGILIVCFGLWSFFTSPTGQKVMDYVNFFKGAGEYKTIILYTSNLAEIVKPKELGRNNEEKIAALKSFIKSEREAAAAEKAVFLIIDAGNYLFDSSEIGLNTEDSFKIQNELEYSAAGFGLRDMVFCFNLLEIQPPKFKLPVLCTHVTDNSKDSATPDFFKQLYFKNERGIVFCLAGFTDADAAQKIPSKYSKKYSFKDPVKIAEQIFTPKYIKPSEYNMIIAVSHNGLESAREMAQKAPLINFIIYIDGETKKTGQPGYSQAGATYLLPSKIEKNKVACAKFEFIYERKQRIIKEPRFSFKEL